ncbi:MAG: hypothetical protein RL154_968 [Pseudomonadota bacterium]
MKIKNIGVALRPNDENIANVYEKLKKKLKEFDVNVYLENSASSQIGNNGYSYEELAEMCDILISLGGDGTLLGLARKTCAYNKPLLGINAGTLGFLTTASRDNFEDMIDNLFIGNYEVEERMMMDLVVHTEFGESELVALNDIVITKNLFSKMIDIKVESNDELINRYYGDGLIVSTPTGSTAYNLSACGPVFFPLAKNFILTPICPHSLSQRTLVLHYDMEIKLYAPCGSAIVIVDGQESFTLGAKDYLTIKKNPVGAKFIMNKNFNHFKVLREKLHWGKER